VATTTVPNIGRGPLSTIPGGAIIRASTDSYSPQFESVGTIFISFASPSALRQLGLRHLGTDAPGGIGRRLVDRRPQAPGPISDILGPSRTSSREHPPVGIRQGTSSTEHPGGILQGTSPRGRPPGGIHQGTPSRGHSPADILHGTSPEDIRQRTSPRGHPPGGILQGASSRGRPPGGFPRGASSSGHPPAPPTQAPGRPARLSPHFNLHFNSTF